MGKIYGDENLIKSARAAMPGDKSIYVNWEAIDQLPDEFESTISKVVYDPANLEKSFSPVGNDTYMPRPEMMYEIAEKCGISGGNKSISEPLIEEVDINPLLRKPLGSEPTYRKMTVGRKVVKYSTKIQEDGSILRSSPCTSEYNVWERCKLDWSKEELDTNGYQGIETGSYQYFNKKAYGDYYKKGQYCYPVKYNTALKRQHHFDCEMKFAHAKAETKANLKAIRELSNLVTGFKKNELTTGCLVFAKVRRSREVMRMETAARLAAMSKGLSSPPQESEANLLFDSVPQKQDIIPEPSILSVEEETPQEKTARERMVATINYYVNNSLLDQGSIQTANPLLKWLEGNENAEQDTTYWLKAIEFLKTAESKIPIEGRLTHELY